MSNASLIVWNMAIAAAVREYDRGKDAVAGLRRPVTVAVTHEGRSTKQEVSDGE